jgi:uncharacterized protein YbaR (Trm112 family)
LSHDLKLHPLLKKLLCCPACKGSSELLEKLGKEVLECSDCQKQYTLRKVAGPDEKGMFIPVLLLEG